MAIVILGGLVTSTILNLFVVPVLALRHSNIAEQHSNGAAPSPSMNGPK